MLTIAPLFSQDPFVHLRGKFGVRSYTSELPIPISSLSSKLTFANNLLALSAFVQWREFYELLQFLNITHRIYCWIFFSNPYSLIHTNKVERIIYHIDLRDGINTGDIKTHSDLNRTLYYRWRHKRIEK